MLYGNKSVALRVTVPSRSGAQVDVHGGSGSDVTYQVFTRAAVNIIRAGAAANSVIARASENGLGFRVATQRISILRANQHLNVAQGIAFGKTSRAAPGTQADGHAGIRQGIIDRVRALTAVYFICRGGSDDGVVAVAAVESVIAAGIAAYGVTKIRTENIFYVQNGIGIRHDRLCASPLQINDAA